MSRLSNLVIALLLSISASAAPQSPAGTLLDDGYRDMYNLQFGDAHQAFQKWQQAHPEDPLGPASDAAAYLFDEFDRLHILEVELFVDDAKFETAISSRQIRRSNRRSRRTSRSASRSPTPCSRAILRIPMLSSPLP